jgi:hypothetical protein
VALVGRGNHFSTELCLHLFSCWRHGFSPPETLHNEPMNDERPMNSCHRCGATAYKPVVARSDKGVMQRNGQYQCVKCNLTFTDIREWRDGSSPIATQEKT